MGVGLIVAVSPEHLPQIVENSDGYPIGKVVVGEKGVTLQ
jgi:phosphoribosylaminoimidazole (AIR) synthetase